MKTITFRRSLVIRAIILFVGAFVIPSITQGTTIYVDDDNTTGPWYGTMEHPYQHIQDGINHSTSGDTVFVFNGFYRENVIVNKSIDLTGENRDSTIIDGGGIGNVVTVSVVGVSISLFTIQKSGKGRDSTEVKDSVSLFGSIINNNSIGIVAYSSSRIFDNLITDNGIGVWLSHSSNTYIFGNTITNSDAGIGIEYSPHSHISGNTIAKNSGCGIYLVASSEITISENTITNTAVGIYLMNSPNNTISRNIILCHGEGIYLEYHSTINIISGNTIEALGSYGVYAQDSRKNAITKNTITNSYCGVYLEVLADSSLISENIIANNNSGVFIQDSRYNIITENIFTNSTYSAIDVEESFNNISGNTITNSMCGIWVERRYNTIRDNNIANTGWGIFLFWDCVYDTVMGNTIRDCGRGMYLEWASYNTIAENTLINNGTGISSFRGPNLIYNNNFFNNNRNVDEETPNNWDNGYRGGGNYWDDFDEPLEGAYDNYFGPDQNIPGSDGIVDVSYSIPYESSKDRYPLTEPWSGSLPTTIFVDDDNATGPWDGTPEHPFQYIQEGIKNAKEGDIVYAHDGTYYEHVTIDKKLTLAGENMDKVVVDGGGSGDVVNISSDTVRIRKFTVQHGEVGIKVCAKDNTISENVITDNTLGLQVEGPSTNNFIFHNNFINNPKHAYDPSTNSWDHGYLYGGNFWDDYTGSDNYRGPNQDLTGGDGIGDTPYSITGGSNQDNYPLMNPWDGTFPVPPRDTVYVDDDFDENLPGWGYNHFDKIQEGIDSVALRGTVHVFNGSYYENVVVDKTINLIGENKDSTVVDGNGGDVVIISADSVYMTGFTVKNGLKGIDLFPSSNTRVFDNITTGNSSCGIRLANSKNDTISNNTITKNDLFGIDLNHASDNRIYMNIIEDNGYGVLDNYSSNNIIYHNDFINNNQNAYAVNPNFWDNGYPSGGNYWDDYTGVDSLSGPGQDIPGSDGIGDTPYNIPPGGKQDNYPLMNTCFGLYAHANGPYSEFVNEPVHFTGSAHGNSPPYSWHWNFGDGDTSDIQNPTHTYDTVGEYIATLTIMDSMGSSDTDTITVTIKPRLSSIWVDDNFDESTPGWGYDHFDNVNDGIDAVYYGGSVYVYEGSYHEHVRINKTISLIGEDREGTTISYEDTIDVIKICANSVNLSGFTIQHSGGSAYYAGIEIWSDSNTINENNIINNGKGISLRSSSKSIICANNIKSNGNGIQLDSSSNNIITENIFTDNKWCGVKLDASSDSNTIYHNNFINNLQNASDRGGNIWDNGYPSGGNYWDDYTGSDSFSGPGQNISGSDGIGDTPYIVPVGGNQDNYPLMSPWSPYTCGDVNVDGEINVADIVYIINYLFRSGPPPRPLLSGDVNCDGVIDIADVVYLINYLFVGGPPLGC